MGKIYKTLRLNPHIVLLCTLLQLLLSITVVNKANAQLIVTDASQLPQWNADSLVRNILLDEGVSVFNARFNGSASVIDCNSIGKFETGTYPTNLGMESGLIIASGGASVAIGPNDVQNANILHSCDSYNDDDLSNIASNTVFDVSVLEFDFVPWSDTLSFKFVFGSEEYPEYVGSQYNDVFGFFLSGINPQGGYYENQNMALIPGTNEIVSINSLNAGNNSDYYIDNTDGSTIQFDGFTTLLNVRCSVVPMTTYHIKMAICDVSDYKFDSGVFIESQSFTTNLAYSMTIDTVLYTNIPNNYYYCADRVIEFNTITEWEYDDVTWYFGDGTSSFGPEATHVYEEDGFYNVMNVLHNPHKYLDSIYLNKVIEVRSPRTDITTTICKGESYFINGNEYNQTGIYIDTLTSCCSCDSIVTLNLTVVDVDTTYINVNACDSYNWFGQTYYNSGQYTHMLNSVHGCDSLLIMDLTINESSSTHIADEVCDQYELFGQIYYESGQYTYTFNTVNGCDSIITLDLIVHKTPDLEIHGLSQVAISSDLWPGIYSYCLADSTELQQCDITWTCSNHNWIVLPSDDPYWFTIIVNSLGSATLTATAQCDSGCDAVTTFEINASYLDVDDIDDNTVLMYPNPANDILIIKGNQLKKVTIYDFYGQKLSEIEVNESDEITIDTGNLANGLYITDIVTTRGKTIKQLFISK